jgi:hypothetical protein
VRTECNKTCDSKMIPRVMAFLVHGMALEMMSMAHRLNEGLMSLLGFQVSMQCINGAKRCSVKSVYLNLRPASFGFIATPTLLAIATASLLQLLVSVRCLVNY